MSRWVRPERAQLRSGGWDVSTTALPRASRPALARHEGNVTARGVQHPRRGAIAAFACALFVASAFGATLLAVVPSPAFAQYAPQQAGTQPLSPELEARVQALGKQIRCAVCQGMSIADSPASMARAQLDTVRTMVKDGRSDQEIKDFFVERYGEFALLKPSTDGVNSLVWLGPVAVFLLGLGFAVYYVAQHKPGAAASPAAGAAASPNATADASAPAASSDDPYVNALRSELDR